MCMCCSAKARTIKKDVLPGYNLLVATEDVEGSQSDRIVKHRDGIGLVWPKGWYALQTYNDPDLIWEPKVWPDPLKGLNANTHPKEYKLWEKWAEDVEKMEQALVLPAETGYELVKACYKAGYRKRNGRLAYWLFDHIARQLKRK